MIAALSPRGCPYCGAASCRGSCDERDDALNAPRAPHRYDSRFPCSCTSCARAAVDAELERDQARDGDLLAIFDALDAAWVAALDASTTAGEPVARAS